MDFSQLPAPDGDPWYVFRVVVNVVEAIGVVGAVVVALWDRIAAVIWKPRLSLRFENESAPLKEEVVEDEGTIGASNSVAHVSDVQLRNDSHTPGTNCRLHVARFERFSIDGRCLPHTRRYRVRPDPWGDTNADQVSVLHEVPGRLRLLEVRPRASLPQTAHEGGPPPQPHADVSLPFLQDAATGDVFRLEPGKYEIELLVVADGGHRTKFVIEVMHQGLWRDRVQVMLKEDLISLRRLQSGSSISRRA